jgi:hypothetical protein
VIFYLNYMKQYIRHDKAEHVCLVLISQRKIQSTQNRNVLCKGNSQCKINNKTNKQRKEEEHSLDNFSSPHKTIILKVGKRYMHVAHLVHIGKCLQSVEIHESRIRNVIVSVLAKCGQSRVGSNQKHLLFLC